ncbi:MAG: beta-mannosidase [Halanaerobiaceae bacterium]
MKETIELGGNWRVEEYGSGDSLLARVPGCIHQDLKQAGRIGDPFYRNTEEELFWIGEKDWEYSREFFVEGELLAREEINLVCEGLDTLAEIYLNGKMLGKTDNMFRTWRFNLNGNLRQGTNEIKIIFRSPMEYLRKKDNEDYIPAWSVGDHRLHGAGWLRKQPSNFGWDWGPKLVTCGIWREIKIEAYDRARIEDVHIRQEHTSGETVDVFVSGTIVCLDGMKPDMVVKIKKDGRQIARKKMAVTEADNTGMVFRIDNPELWWPNDLGDQPLYIIDVSLAYGQEIIDSVSKKIGLRTVKLITEEDRWGESFKFAVNGKEIFIKGANWIPADAFVAGLAKKDYERHLQAAVGAGMNMVRVWGGGIYEDDIFYELCDEKGLLVWQDFIFACGTYPTYDQDFLASVEQEVRDNVKRLRHHPSLALWCGNNEIEQGIAAGEWDKEKVTMSWEDYSRLFDNLLPELVAELDPDTDYWPGSPHSPRGDRSDHRNEKWGDVHIWEVWHGKKPFEYYRECLPRFCSEFGFQSFAGPKTVEKFTLPRDRNVTSYVMEHRQRSGIGNTTIVQYLLSWFRLPEGFTDILRVSQILQGLAIKYAVEHWRRNMDRMGGTLYWQLNDNWPAISWSSVDYHGRWKALNYMARRFYSPLLLSAVKDSVNWTVDLHVTSDKRQKEKGTVSWFLTDLEGNTVAGEAIDVFLLPGQNNEVGKLELLDLIKEYGQRKLMLWLELEVAGETVSENFVSFVRPKHLNLQQPGISAGIEKISKKNYVITLETEKPALWINMEVKDSSTDVKWSNNYFHLRPGKLRKITVNTDRDFKSEDLQDILNVSSLVDTY